MDWRLFKNRFQQTKVHGVVSEAVSSELGVPQGSVLDPLFFFLYGDELSAVVNNCLGRFFFVPIAGRNLEPKTEPEPIYFFRPKP